MSQPLVNREAHHPEDQFLISVLDDVHLNFTPDPLPVLISILAEQLGRSTRKIKGHFSKRNAGRSQGEDNLHVVLLENGTNKPTKMSVRPHIGVAGAMFTAKDLSEYVGYFVRKHQSNRGGPTQAVRSVSAPSRPQIPNPSRKHPYTESEIGFVQTDGDLKATQHSDLSRHRALSESRHSTPSTPGPSRRHWNLFDWRSYWRNSPNDTHSSYQHPSSRPEYTSSPHASPDGNFQLWENRGYASEGQDTDMVGSRSDHRPYRNPFKERHRHSKSHSDSHFFFPR